MSNSVAGGNSALWSTLIQDFKNISGDASVEDKTNAGKSVEEKAKVKKVVASLETTLTELVEGKISLHAALSKLVTDFSHNGAQVAESLTSHLNEIVQDFMKGEIPEFVAKKLPPNILDSLQVLLKNVAKLVEITKELDATNDAKKQAVLSKAVAKLNKDIGEDLTKLGAALLKDMTKKTDMMGAKAPDVGAGDAPAASPAYDNFSLNSVSGGDILLVLAAAFVALYESQKTLLTMDANKVTLSTTLSNRLSAIEQATETLSQVFGDYKATVAPPPTDSETLLSALFTAGASGTGSFKLTGNSSDQGLLVQVLNTLNISQFSDLPVTQYSGAAPFTGSTTQTTFGPAMAALIADAKAGSVTPADAATFTSMLNATVNNVNIGLQLTGAGSSNNLLQILTAQSGGAGQGTDCSLYDNGNLGTTAGTANRNANSVTNRLQTSIQGTTTTSNAILSTNHDILNQLGSLLSNITGQW